MKSSHPTASTPEGAPKAGQGEQSAVGGGRQDGDGSPSASNAKHLLVTSCRSLHVERAVSDMTAALVLEMLPDELDDATMQTLSRDLPSMLETFSRKIGQCHPSKTHLDTMHIVHRNRK